MAEDEYDRLLIAAFSLGPTVIGIWLRIDTGMVQISQSAVAVMGAPPFLVST